MRQPVHGGNLAWAAAVAGCPAEAILDFSASISPLGPPNKAIAAIHANLSNLRHYPDPDYRELRVALSRFHQLPCEWILPGNGSAEILTLAGRELAKLSVTCLITPAFGDYYRTLGGYRAKVLEFPLSCNTGQWELEGNSLGYIYPLPGSGLLLNNPHNPTGKLFSREAILHDLEGYSLVVVDEAFMDFIPPNQAQSLIEMVQECPNLVILRSLTKFYSLPGLRLGYAIAHPDRLAEWQLWRDPWPVNTLAAAAAVAAIEDVEFQNLTWQWLPSARQQLFEGLAAIPGLQPFPSAANFLLVAVSPPVSAWDLQQNLLRHHRILIRDCLSFRELGSGFFRVAVRSESDNQCLLQALRNIIDNL